MKYLYEKVYHFIADTAKVEYATGSTIKCEVLLDMLNAYLPPCFQYGALRGSVFHAAWIRTDDYGKEAMENVFVNSRGKALL